MQLREQQSSLLVQVSPTCLLHGLTSRIAQGPSALQREMPDLSGLHRPLQQSAAVTQTSPCTRHPGNNWQRLASSTLLPHELPQHSPAPAQYSPATLQGGPGAGGPGFSHLPELQRLLQQSLETRHTSPTPPQMMFSAHAPDPASSTEQASEQHCPAMVQGPLNPVHPGVGLHVKVAR